MQMIDKKNSWFKFLWKVGVKNSCNYAVLCRFKETSKDEFSVQHSLRKFASVFIIVQLIWHVLASDVTKSFIL